MRKAVALLSSGLDSAANLALANEAGIDVQLALTFDYGQRAAVKEIESAKRLSDYFGISHLVVNLRNFPEWLGSSGSALLDEGSMPSPESLDDLAVIRKSAKAVWVPNRNGVFISIAAAAAEARDASVVLVGFNAEEAVTFPDNSRAYISAMNASLEFSTANRVKVESLTSAWNKKEIVARLLEFSPSFPNGRFPFEAIWSCYVAENQHCGICESCQRLRRALLACDAVGVANKIFTKNRDDGVPSA
ncbi:MAG TPA: 7-cyano-7-deazaguanine synthase QueC [Oligoflexia bacterium]|nr:7-cyano-7-deazaguanine synthase QueC [Oligoflexia bacterium]